ncbi:stringent starvation protein A [Marinihelvus fidelis]|uniref:Stringent starvation protein A n=2 Tax=Marinihelvus fidelis TaxID=2613842 RepID=A0A5N0TEC9_9GAMM|nr:glutathione S-transferase N-terminal domain-containing protein [Marinihelvus fidelis]KAA9132814.1 stringent starvation protein A [Marinihelvus fidelis]
MALYSSASCIQCHRVRFVLAEKGINVEIVDVESDAASAEDMAELTPYNETPTLVDRDLVLYDAGVINEYLDERYPHPPLMPVDPVSRARLRLVHYRVLRDWYALAAQIEAATGKKADAPRKQLKEGIIAANELFENSDFLLSDELSLVDCTLAPLFWRLPAYGIDLGKSAPAVQGYIQRLISRSSFKASLTTAERELVLNAA